MLQTREMFHSDRTWSKTNVIFYFPSGSKEEMLVKWVDNVIELDMLQSCVMKSYIDILLQCIVVTIHGATSLSLKKVQSLMNME